MSFFDTEAGEALLEIVSHWGQWDRYKDYYLNELAPSFVRDLNGADDVEKQLLVTIKSNLNTEQWLKLPELLGEAADYLSKVDWRKEKQKKFNERIKKDRHRWEEEQQKARERAEAEARRQKEEKQKEEERIKKEQDSLREKKQEEEKRTAAAKARAKKSIKLLFVKDFLSSKDHWQSKRIDWITAEEFDELSVQFIKEWFEKQGWQVPDYQQALSIAEVWDDVQVIARAGSGKTATIVNRATFLIKHCRVSPSEILLLTFNKKAADEVYDRLHKRLGVSAPQAMTFHALAYGIVHPEEDLLVDDEIKGLKKSASVQQVIDDCIHDKAWSEKIKNLMLKYFRADWEYIFSRGYHLSPEEIVKYRRLMPRIGLDGKYYKSMGEKKLADYLFEHDIPYWYEKNFWWNELNYKPDFRIPLKNQLKKEIVIEYFGMTGDSDYDKQIIQKREFWRTKDDYLYIELYPGDTDSLEKLEQTVKPHLLTYGFTMYRLTEEEIWYRIKERAVDHFSSLVSQFIGRCRKAMISPEKLVEMLKDNINDFSELHINFMRVVWKIYKEYLELLSKHKEEDFDGLMLKTIEKLNSGHSRWSRKKGAGDLLGLKYIFIDEYQDFSLLFYHTIKAIKDMNPEVKLFCVGDDWQAINAFAGSDLCFFNNFNEYFPGAKQLQILCNYRSCKNIVELSNNLMDGEGEPSKATIARTGEIWVADINKFKPSYAEKIFYKGDNITPALLRLVYRYVMQGQRVALLCRKNGLPWYTPYSPVKGKFHEEFLSAIRQGLPEGLRTMLVAMDTTHSYKGKEEDTIIVVDVVNRSYPLLHPNIVFFEILGQSIADVIDEEKRLLYVALTRAKKSLVIVTEKDNESPFLEELKTSTVLHTINWDRLIVPKRKGSKYYIRLSNLQEQNLQNGSTNEIESYLLACNYSWKPAQRVWSKSLSAKSFSKEKLLSEPWVEYANGLSISVTDEFENEILQYNIIDGKAFDNVLTD